MKFSVYQVTRRGGRRVNEDRLGYCYTREAALLVLADGMGGHPEGEKAAELAVETFSRCFLASALPSLADISGFLVNTLNQANQAIVDYAQARAMPDSPRTTVVAALLQNNRLHTIHTGDSRAYWVRDGRVIDRTRDHSYHEKAELFRGLPEGLSRSVLFTCLGSATAPLYDLGPPRALQRGDRLLLCSDGLWSEVADEEIAQRLSEGPLHQVVPDLGELAVTRGGRHGDNVSLLALDWDTPDAFEPTMVHTEQIDDGGYASGLLPPDYLDELAGDFDDDAIERSIAEINEAIRRSAQRRRS